MDPGIIHHNKTEDVIKGVFVFCKLVKAHLGGEMAKEGWLPAWAKETSKAQQVASGGRVHRSRCCGAS